MGGAFSPRVLAAGVGLYGLTAASTYCHLQSKTLKPGPGGPGSSSGSPQGASYDQLADSYDRQVGLDETLMGINLLRRWVVRQAKGDTLEISAGTGRNLDYYSYTNLTSLTLTDSSANMLEQAHDKAKSLLRARRIPEDCRVDICQGRAEGLCSSCASSAAERNSSSSKSAGEGPEPDFFVPNVKPCKTPLADGSFDTVVDTFGLCSHDNPVEVLKEMVRACRPGGQILLIEHGQASWDWLNELLDRNAPKHFERWGCWWNKDINRIVQEAGLNVVSCSRWHFGTTYVIRATVDHPTA